jgi:hypothetical protein
LLPFSFNEFRLMSLEPFLADKAAEMVRFPFICDFEFSRVFIKKHSADGVSKHLLWPVPRGKIVVTAYYG